MKTITQLLCYALFLFGLHSLNAAVINAASGSYSDVTKAVATASYGDTVQIPAGTWTWTTPNLTISGITLAGAGTNATFISDGLPPNGGGIAYLLNCVTVPNALTRVTGITFQDAGGGSLNYHGKVEFNGMAGGPASSWRLDHCQFINLQGPNVYCHGFAISVVDHCSFFLIEEGIGQYGINAAANDYYGDSSYATPPAYGTTNALYIENCFFTNTLPAYSSCGAYDGYAGARVVFRNNYLARCSFATHGNDTSGRYRSVRSYEIYNNVFVHNQDFVTAMDFRGGTGVVWSNTVTGYENLDTIENYRNIEANYWGGVTGINSWDSNSPTLYLTATNNGVSGGIVSVGSTISQGTVVVNGANWIPNQWAGYIFYDPNANSYNAPAGNFLGAGANPICLIQGNTANRLIFTAPKDYVLLTTNGDIFNIRYAAAALDQVGRGSGDLLQDITAGGNTYTINTVTGTNSWPHQVLEPLYSWGNTLNGSPAGVVSSYPNIVEGREIYANAVKPGYAPLPYPHPLENLTNTVSSPVATGTLSPPSGLAVVSTPVNAVVDTNNLLAWYRFSEGNGATTADSSGGMNTGTLIGSPIWTTGPTGKGALKFNGSGQYVIVKSGAILGGLSAWSITCWVQLTSNNSSLPFYSESENGGNDRISLGTRGAWPYYPQVFYQNDGAAFNATVTGNTGAPDGAWHFIAATFNGSTLTLYIDGVIAGTPQAWSSNNNFTEAGIQSRIAGLNGSGLTFGGSEADVRLYSATLNAAQVSTIYAAGAQ